ncbi:hypothetical protein V5799_025114 [Amblyomma americanum]|uniref:Uncharacterized protein n=1 Tax=Amblyomma americanum TaxID=6943 RepID=A0AAQ4EA40_AMBAM
MRKREHIFQEESGITFDHVVRNDMQMNELKPRGCRVRLLLQTSRVVPACVQWKSEAVFRVPIVPTCTGNGPGYLTVGVSLTPMHLPTGAGSARAGAEFETAVSLYCGVGDTGLELEGDDFGVACVDRGSSTGRGEFEVLDSSWLCDETIGSCDAPVVGTDDILMSLGGSKFGGVLAEDGISPRSPAEVNASVVSSGWPCSSFSGIIHTRGLYLETQQEKKKVVRSSDPKKPGEEMTGPVVL